MTKTEPVQTAFIGCGDMGRHHIRAMLRQLDTTHITVVCEPSQTAYELTIDLFQQANLTPPPNQPDLERLLEDYGNRLDAAFIVTPHAYHHNQAGACMDAGLDVLVEKPMVVSAEEAKSLIGTRDRTGKLLVVAFPGSLSPQIRTAVTMLRSGQLGQILTISAIAWQNWRTAFAKTWRQQPDVSGGGFLFDTGAHMLNTVVDLAGEDFVEVAAWFDNRDLAVDVLGTVMGRLASGVLVTLHGCGETIPSCASDVRVFCPNGILRTGIWGERLEVQYPGQEQPSAVEVPPSQGPWDQFLAVRNGQMPNPCPPEVGLRMARLWDAIKASASQNGMFVRCG